MSHDILYITPHDATSVNDWLEVIGRLKRQRYARKRAAELRHRYHAPAACRIHDLHPIFTPSLKDDKMRKFPVKNRTFGQVWQRLQLQPHTAATEAIPARRPHKCECIHAITMRAGHVTHIAERHMLAVICQYHYQAGRTAFRG